MSSDLGCFLIIQFHPLFALGRTVCGATDPVGLGLANGNLSSSIKWIACTHTLDLYGCGFALSDDPLDCLLVTCPVWLGLLCWHRHLRCTGGYLFHELLPKELVSGKCVKCWVTEISLDSSCLQDVFKLLLTCEPQIWFGYNTHIVFLPCLHQSSLRGSCRVLFGLCCLWHRCVPHAVWCVVCACWVQISCTTDRQLTTGPPTHPPPPPYPLAGGLSESPSPKSEPGFDKEVWLG